MESKRKARINEIISEWDAYDSVKREVIDLNERPYEKAIFCGYDIKKIKSFIRKHGLKQIFFDTPQKHKTNYIFRVHPIYRKYLTSFQFHLLCYTENISMGLW